MINREIQIEILNFLDKEIESFRDLKLQEDELNIDKYLKENIQRIIKSNLKNINENLSDNKLKIKSVLTKEEYFSTKRVRVNEKEISKFCDLVLVYERDGIQREDELEIKKTNSNKIPGSSIKQIKPEKTVIFLKYSKNKIDLEIGYYFQLVEEEIPFPDRSPRPTISFNALKDSNERLTKKETTMEELIESSKSVFDDNWIEQLVNNWMTLIKNKSFRKTWFHKAIAIFVLKLWSYFDTISPEDKKELKEYLKKYK